MKNEGRPCVYASRIKVGIIVLDKGHQKLEGPQSAPIVPIIGRARPIDSRRSSCPRITVRAEPQVVPTTEQKVLKISINSNKYNSDNEKVGTIKEEKRCTVYILGSRRACFGLDNFGR